MTTSSSPFICGAGTIAFDSIRLNTALKDIASLMSEIESVHEITENIYDEFRKVSGYYSDEPINLNFETKTFVKSEKGT